MFERSELPDANRLSVLTAIILLAYVASQLVDISARVISFSLLGVIFDFVLDFNVIVSLLVAVLAAVGTNWLLYGDELVSMRSRIPHWILPAVTAWVIGQPLRNLEMSIQWWAVFIMGSLLLIFVLVSEYVVVDLSNRYYAPAYVGLTAFSFALYLYLAIAIRSTGMRLYLLLPALLIPLFALILRTMYLRLSGKWFWDWAIGIPIVIGQIAIGLHYLPMNPIIFGLVLLGPVYGLTSLAGLKEENQSGHLLLFEPLLMLMLVWGLAFFFRS